MDVQLKDHPAVTVVGMKYRGKNEHNEIPALWDRFIPRMDEIGSRAHAHISYGVMGNYDPATGEFDYLAGVPVERAEDLPEGMERWDVPAGSYAVFETTLPKLRDTYSAIYNEWLPQSGYQHAMTTEFEYYDERFDEANQVMSIYVPVAR